MKSVPTGDSYKFAGQTSRRMQCLLLKAHVRTCAFHVRVAAAARISAGHLAPVFGVQIAGNYPQRVVGIGAEAVGCAVT